MDMRKKIKVKMAEKGIKSDVQLAERIGISPQNLNDRYKRGADFRISMLEKIADALDCELIVEFKDKER